MPSIVQVNLRQRWPGRALIVVYFSLRLVTSENSTGHLPESSVIQNHQPTRLVLPMNTWQVLGLLISHRCFSLPPYFIKWTDRISQRTAQGTYKSLSNHASTRKVCGKNETVNAVSGKARERSFRQERLTLALG